MSAPAATALVITPPRLDITDKAIVEAVPGILLHDFPFIAVDQLCERPSRRLASQTSSSGTVTLSTWWERTRRASVGNTAPRHMRKDMFHTTLF
eukprot:9480978-Pyramimonas_sp.AAC.2